MTLMYSKNEENRAAIKPPFKTDDITKEHKWYMSTEQDRVLHPTYFNGYTIPEIKKHCGISDKNMNLFLNEAEYYRWWDNDDKKAFNQYYFYQGDCISNSFNLVKTDPFYDPILSDHQNHLNSIIFGGFTKKEIINDYFIREGKGYHLLETIQKFYGERYYKEEYDRIVNFAKNRMVYLEEDAFDAAKAIRQKKLEALVMDALDAIQKLADKIREK